MVKEIPQKVRAKVLWDAGFRTPASMKKRGKIPERSAARYISLFKEEATWERSPYPQRAKPSRRPEIVRKVIAKVRNPRKAESLRSIGKACNVSHMTVKNILRDQNFTYKRTQKRVKVDEETKENRIAFAREMEANESDWGFTIFTDECSFWLNKCQPSKSWSNGQNDRESQGSHGPKIHCWGAISARGALKIELFEDNLNAWTYQGIIRRRLPEIKRLYPEGWVWQQDGSGVHRAVTIQKYIDETMPKILLWPPYSPDLSPIENIWGWLKGEVNKDLPMTINALKKSIRKHWKRIDEQFLAPYIDSMPQRMAMVIENEGEPIKY